MFGGGFGGFGGFGGMQGQDQKPEKKEVDTTQYYNLMGVDKKATTQQIRKAFRKKALKQHPDKGGDPDKFKILTHAYDVLTNPQKRQLYDEYGEEGVQAGGPPGGGGFDIFDMFRRKQSSGPRKGKARLIPLQVTLEQIFFGCTKKVKVERTRNCQGCDGKGGKNVQKCSKCKGRRVVQKLVQLGPGMYTQTSQKCPDCKGMGQTMKQQDRCKQCKGEKIKTVARELEVAIEAGCPNEHDYIFTGQGDEGPNVIAGDIYVRVQIKKHKVFIRKGADIAIIKNITLLEALSGVTMQIDHLDGKKYTLATAPGEILSNNDFKVVKKLGMPFYKDPMSYGNLIMEFKVEFPKKNFFGKDKLDKIVQILGAQQKGKTPVLQKKQSKTVKILQQYSEADLNPNPEGGKQQQEQHHYSGGGGRQQVNCQQQ